MGNFKGSNRKFKTERHSAGNSKSKFDKDHRQAKRFSRDDNFREDKREGNFREDRFERRGQTEMTSVICAKCGRQTKVPFRPSGNKPVFCRDCFVKPNERNYDSGEPDNDQLEQINMKLDKIMRFLKINK